MQDLQNVEFEHVRHFPTHGTHFTIGVELSGYIPVEH